MYLYLWLKNWLESNEEGQGLVEYGLILVLVSIVVITALGLIGTNLDLLFREIATTLGL
jgi:pilus assembly protein Flp/PilA